MRVAPTNLSRRRRKRYRREHGLATDASRRGGATLAFTSETPIIVKRLCSTIPVLPLASLRFSIPPVIPSCFSLSLLVPLLQPSVYSSVSLSRTKNVGLYGCLTIFVMETERLSRTPSIPSKWIPIHSDATKMVKHGQGHPVVSRSEIWMSCYEIGDGWTSEWKVEIAGSLAQVSASPTDLALSLSQFLYLFDSGWFTLCVSATCFVNIDVSFSRCFTRVTATTNPPFFSFFPTCFSSLSSSEDQGLSPTGLRSSLLFQRCFSIG